MENRKKKNAIILRLILYGHPRAGLHWERHCHKAILKCGFIKVTGRECLYKNAEKQLFLSVYVGDFKMVGKKESWFYLEGAG